MAAAGEALAPPAALPQLARARAAVRALRATVGAAPARGAGALAVVAGALTCSDVAVRWAGCLGAVLAEPALVAHAAAFARLAHAVARAALVTRGVLAQRSMPARGAHARALDARRARLGAVAVARLLRAVRPRAAGRADTGVVELGRAEADAGAVAGASVHRAVGAAVAGEAHARGRLLRTWRRHAVAVLAAPALARGHAARGAGEAGAAVAGSTIALALAVTAALNIRAHHARREGCALGRRRADPLLAPPAPEAGQAGAALLHLVARALRRLRRLAAALVADVELARFTCARARALARTVDAHAWEGTGLYAGHVGLRARYVEMQVGRTILYCMWGA